MLYVAIGVGNGYANECTRLRELQSIIFTRAHAITGVFSHWTLFRIMKSYLLIILKSEAGRWLWEAS